MDDLQVFHEELFNEVSAKAAANNDFLQRKFFETFCGYLDDAGEINIPEYSYYKDTQGRSINGYNLDDAETGNGSLDLFISTYSGLNEIINLNKDEIESTFKRLENFFTKSINDDKFHQNMEESSDGYGASRFIFSQRHSITNVNLYFLTDKKISARLDSLPSKQIDNIKINYHLWDLTRLYRLVSSERIPEDIVIDFKNDFGEELLCLPANFSETNYKAYLSVIPGIILAKLYDKYGARLLERNVRSFLQAKGKVNKGIRKTILGDPEKFFAYNNGITATADNAEFVDGKIKSLTNLQIVNGGQTTASLFSAYKKDKADIHKVFVQMKLSIVSPAIADEMVPLISEYANSQNKVNATDFFATHAFHKRIQDFSRRIYAPATEGQFQQTKWFYERSRGQYINEYAYSTVAEKRKFQIEYPKNQLITKTDLAKFEGVWMQKPDIVSKGAQYIFLEYANSIGKMWDADETKFNDIFYKIAIAKAIIFKTTEKIVTDSPWYDGGYRANIVAYSLAFIAYKIGNIGKSVDFIRVWNKQSISPALMDMLKVVTKEVHDRLLNNGVMSNIGQYCKKTMCWDMIKKIDLNISKELLEELVDEKEIGEEVKAAKSSQRMENRINAEMQVIEFGEKNWRNLYDFAKSKNLIIPGSKEDGVLAYYFKNKYVSEKQAPVILNFLEKMKLEGFSIT